MQKGGWHGPAVSQDAVQDVIAEIHSNHGRESASLPNSHVTSCWAGRQHRAAWLMRKIGSYRQSSTGQTAPRPRQCQLQELILSQQEASRGSCSSLSSCPHMCQKREVFVQVAGRGGWREHQTSTGGGGWLYPPFTYLLQHPVASTVKGS